MTTTCCKQGGTQTPPPPTNSLPFLSFDLVTEILCQLPVKNLLQLRCICKSWNSLISHDSEFTMKHLRLSTSNLDRHHLFLSSLRTSRLLHLSDSSISSFFSPPSTTSFTQINHYSPILNKNLNFGERVSTYDGMLCVRIDSSSALLCNPSIRKFKILPPLINPDQNYLQSSFTLVYDRFTNNYKIYSLSKTTDGYKQVNVHTLGTDYWRKIQDFPKHYYLVQNPGISLSDTVNWLVYHDRSFARVIVSLDLENELCQELFHPLYNYKPGTCIALGVLRDCLCIFSHSDKFSDVWIMKEYGNVESWTKLLSVPQMGGCGCYIYTKVLYISEDGLMLIYFFKRGKFRLAVYDSINDTLKIPEIQNNIHDLVKEVYLPEVYIETLISPLSQY
ncbi:F-box/kelch-repeat protein At3g23880 [Medicago truncatula]|nr:F-box/kelch-repeat protein At3g23880 [Medicago truncatula]